MSRPSQSNRLQGYFVVTLLALIGFALFLIRTDHSHASSHLAQPRANGRIAFTSDAVLYTINPNGTGRLQLTTDGTNHSPAWSPDGSRIAFNRQGPQDTSNAIYVINADGSGLQRISPAGAVDADPTWSPDGTKIAFVSGNSNAEIFVMNADGNNRMNLTNNPAIDLSPAWSPDGSRIAFVSTRDLPFSGDVTKAFEIYVMNADGSSPIRLTNNAEQDADPSWSPDGGKLTFTTARDGNFEVYAMNADGTGQINLSNNPSSDFQPCWSPDGNKIAFLSFRGFLNTQEIFVMNSDGSNQTRITYSSFAEQELAWQGTIGGPRIVFGSVRNGGNHDIYSMYRDGSDQIRLTNNAAYDDEPKWSPDGTRIVFMSNRDGNFEIYSMNADGSNQSRLTNNPAADGFPAWSPDGTRIAFVSGDLHDPSTFEIYVMNANGSNRIRLTNDSFVDGVPAWSPDGTKIVFMSGATSVFNPNAFEIFVMNADGSNRTRLTNNTVVDGQPSYSPDGTKILFASGDAMNPNGIEIFVMNANGSGRTQLTTNAVTDGFPVWSPDGAKIVFARGNVGDETTVELYVMDADGSNQTRLTNNSFLDWFADWQPPAPAGAATVQFSATNYNVGEGDGSATVTVSRSGDTSGTSSVDFFTSDGTAEQRSDYNFVSGSLTFGPGETSKTFNVIIVDDLYIENAETLSVVLGNTSGAIHGAVTSAILTISDNDGNATTTNPLDNSDAQFFVRQHYYDFLSRTPDPDGLIFWTGQITQCGNDQACLRTKRIDVSNAFFYELEFQQTGSDVYRLYRAAFGNTQPFPNPIPDFNHPGEERKVVAYQAFVQDRARVIGGANLPQAQLDLANTFVQRPEFQSRYPTSLDGPGFVDAVLATIRNDIGVDLGSQKPALITLYNSGGRGAVMYRLADDNAQTNPINNRPFIDAEYNRAFVATQYFGYLRRDPDMAGFLFWLGQVNSASLRDVPKQHAMVCSFITSAEYQQRFSSIVTHTNAECQPTPAPQNVKIAYFSTAGGANSEIFTMNADGSQPTRLTFNTENLEFPSDFSWSPDGSMIAYGLIGHDRHQIILINSDGSGARDLTNATSDEFNPAWSPDGSKIAFDGAEGIYVERLSDGTVIKLANGPNRFPVWSSDGSRIAYVSETQGSSQIFVMNANGSSQTNISNTANYDSDPQWSPGGSTVLFIRRTEAGASNADIFTMNDDGKNQHSLTSMQSFVIEARWSPNGDKIVFQSDHTGLSQIYRINPDGSGLLRLTTNATQDTWPRWSPGGDKLFLEATVITASATGTKSTS